MKKILVNTIEDLDNRLTAYAVVDQLVIDNVREFYGTEIANGLQYALQNKNELHSIARFAQFVGLIRCEDTGLSLTVIDFKGNTDNVLDEYLRYLSNEWEKEDRDKVAQIAQEIIDNPTEVAELEIHGVI